MKAKTLVITHNLDHIGNEGDLVIAAQGTFTDEKHEHMHTNIDYSFGKSYKPQEVRALIGSMLTSIEELFGEKMVTEAMAHWADETGKLVKINKSQAIIYSKSKGIEFKKGGEQSGSKT